MYTSIEIRPPVDGVARLTLARPEKHNALSADMIAELTTATAQLAEDPDIRVVVLDAQGKSFCAGGDLGWMKAQFDADASTRAAEARKLADMLEGLDRFPKALIARVQGNAFGGGIGLMAVCDAVIAVDTARFALTETRLGLIPATIGPYVATRIGPAASRRYFASGRPFGAREAVEFGLVSVAVAESDLDDTVASEVSPWLDCAPGAVSDAKHLLRNLASTAPAERKKLTEQALADRWSTEEARAGVGAFFDRTAPPWRKPGS